MTPLASFSYWHFFPILLLPPDEKNPSSIQLILTWVPRARSWSFRYSPIWGDFYNHSIKLHDIEGKSHYSSPILSSGFHHPKQALWYRMDFTNQASCKSLLWKCTRYKSNLIIPCDGRIFLIQFPNVGTRMCAFFFLIPNPGTHRYISRRIFAHFLFLIVWNILLGGLPGEI